MATIPFALSITHLVSSAGAAVGFAAIVGLAILVLLFFSQARETATLRRRADEAEAQLRELAAYVEQLLRRPAAQPTPTPAPRTGTVGAVPPPSAARVAARQAAFPAASRTAPAPAAAARPGAALSAAALIPAAPAGVGAPALSAATRLIPLAEADSISIRALRNGDGESAPESEASNGAPAPTPPPPPRRPPPPAPRRRAQRRRPRLAPLPGHAAAGLALPGLAGRPPAGAG